MNSAVLSYQIFTESTDRANLDKLREVLRNNNQFKPLFQSNVTTFQSRNEDIEINIFRGGIIEILARITAEATADFVPLLSSLASKMCSSLMPTPIFTTEIFIQEEKPVVLENILNKEHINKNIKGVNLTLSSQIDLKITRFKNRYAAHIKTRNDLESVNLIYSHLTERNNPLEDSFDVSNVSIESSTIISF
jgi:hypothetical protein